MVIYFIWKVVVLLCSINRVKLFLFVVNIDPCTKLTQRPFFYLSFYLMLSFKAFTCIYISGIGFDVNLLNIWSKDFVSENVSNF